MPDTTQPANVHTAATGASEGSFRHPVAPHSPTSPLRLSWSALIAGVACALALEIMLTVFGASFGVYPFVSPVAEAGSGWGSTAFWVIASLASLFAGGFVAARTAGIPLATTAVMHGSVVWAVLLVVTATMTFATATNLISGSLGAVAQSAETVRIVRQDLDEGGTLVGDPAAVAGFDVSAMLPEGMSAELRQALEERDLTINRIRADLRDTRNEVISEQEAQRLGRASQAAVMDIIHTPGDAPEDIDQALNVLVGSNGVIDGDDRAYIVNRLEDRLGVERSEAEAVVENWGELLSETQDEVVAAAETAREEIVEEVEAATAAMADVAFSAGIAMLLGLIAANAGAVVGRPDALLGQEIFAEGRS